MNIPDPWRKSESQQMHQGENMLSEARCIGVMFGNFQITFALPPAVTISAASASSSVWLPAWRWHLSPPAAGRPRGRNNSTCQ
ncbi:hypothetical protein ABK675_22800 [Hafnia paralvei]|uniref:hypothetical protein n=1 Tax=Hafnia paralvei TaxID=546367 RepID=UPI000B24E8A5